MPLIEVPQGEKAQCGDEKECDAPFEQQDGKHLLAEPGEDFSFQFPPDEKTDDAEGKGVERFEHMHRPLGDDPAYRPQDHADQDVADDLGDVQLLDQLGADGSRANTHPDQQQDVRVLTLSQNGSK